MRFPFVSTFLIQLGPEQKGCQNPADGEGRPEVRHEVAESHEGDRQEHVASALDVPSVSPGGKPGQSKDKPEPEVVGVEVQSGERYNMNLARL